MNESNQWDDDDLPTLDPPGTIAVIGAGPLGIEAALYGRYLGYNVTIVEAQEVGHSLRDQGDSPLPILPNRCLSPLAAGALSAQEQDSAGLTLPLTFGQWIENILVPLTETDLLRGRLMIGKRVAKIHTVPIVLEEGEQEDDVDSIPPDFRLTFSETIDQTQSLDVESVIVAIGNSPPMELGFALPAPYFFQIGRKQSDQWEESLLAGHHEIVDVYSQLAGRDDLDLYRPPRV
jgi:hypothetical protein